MGCGFDLFFLMCGYALALQSSWTIQYLTTLGTWLRFPELKEEKTRTRNYD